MAITRLGCECIRAGGACGVLSTCWNRDGQYRTHPMKCELEKSIGIVQMFSYGLSCGCWHESGPIIVPWAEFLRDPDGKIYATPGVLLYTKKCISRPRLKDTRSERFVGYYSEYPFV